jgi:hypothetical protein
MMELKPPTSNLQHPASGIQHPESSIQHPVPIIAMTAHAMAGDEDKSFQAGMNGHVTKPIDPDQLFATLQKWIQPSEKRVTTQKPVVSVEPSVDTNVISAEENICKLTDKEITTIPAEFAKDIAKRCRDAAEMGDVMTLNAIAEEIKTHSDFCVPLGKQIIQMAEDFDLDGIQKLADALDAG